MKIVYLSSIATLRFLCIASRTDSNACSSCRVLCHCTSSNNTSVEIPKKKTVKIFGNGIFLSHFWFQCCCFSQCSSPLVLDAVESDFFRFHWNAFWTSIEAQLINSTKANANFTCCMLIFLFCSRQSIRCEILDILTCCYDTKALF